MVNVNDTLMDCSGRWAGPIIDETLALLNYHYLDIDQDILNIHAIEKMKISL